MILIIGKGEKDLSRKSRDFIYFFLFEKEEESARVLWEEDGPSCCRACLYLWTSDTRPWPETPKTDSYKWKWFSNYMIVHFNYKRGKSKSICLSITKERNENTCILFPQSLVQNQSPLAWIFPQINQGFIGQDGVSDVDSTDFLIHDGPEKRGFVFV